MPSTLAGTLCVAMVLAGTASAAPETAADREEARITIEAGGYDAGRGDQAAVNIYVAAALAQCADRRLTMIEEMRLGILLIGDIEPWTSLSEVSVALQSALSMRDSDCESPQVQSAIREFSAEVLPQLQSPILR